MTFNISPRTTCYPLTPAETYWLFAWFPILLHIYTSWAPRGGDVSIWDSPFCHICSEEGTKAAFQTEEKTCIFSQMLLWSFVCLCFLLTFPNSKQNMAWKQSFMGYSGKGTRSEDLLIETPVLQSSGWYIYGKERKDSLGTREVPILEKKIIQKEVREKTQNTDWISAM